MKMPWWPERRDCRDTSLNGKNQPHSLIALVGHTGWNKFTWLASFGMRPASFMTQASEHVRLAGPSIGIGLISCSEHAVVWCHWSDPGLMS